jgi:hypothetical protein
MCQASASADHLPEELLASGKPETILAGIDLKTTKLKDVMRKYGSPAREKSWISGTGYVWQLPHAKIELSVNRGRLGTQIRAIYIEGTASESVGSTGRGLKLGDDVKKLKRIYGGKFELQTLRNEPSENRIEFTGVSVANQRITIQWRLEDFTLTVGFDGNGKIIAMWLILPECYPGGCE